MTELAIEALRAERLVLLDLCEQLTEEEWSAASDCDGWTVQNVVDHMAAIFHGMIDPSSRVPGPGGTEANASAQVDARRGRPPSETVAEYAEFSEPAIDRLAGMQSPEMREVTFQLGELGTYPMHLLANALAFDHFCHIRADMLAPNGPIQRTVPAGDETRLRPTIEWMVAGIPQMMGDALSFMDRPLVLRLEGPGAGSWTIGPAVDGGQPALSEGEVADAAAAITGDTAEFVVWGTQRRPWRDCQVKISGDEAYAARFLDACNIV